jgi:hypothetical protein
MATLQQAAEQPKKKTSKHWYFITYEECVYCGCSETTKERRYDDKPIDPNDRHKFNQFVCGKHFC